MKFTLLLFALGLFFSAGVLANSASASTDPVWIDVRSVGEYKAGHIAGDANIPYKKIGQLIGQLVGDKDTEIKLYCAVGARASVALNILRQKGYTNVTNAGGIAAVRKARKLK